MRQVENFCNKDFHPFLVESILVPTYSLRVDVFDRLVPLFEPQARSQRFLSSSITALINATTHNYATMMLLLPLLVALLLHVQIVSGFTYHDMIAKRGIFIQWRCRLLILQATSNNENSNDGSGKKKGYKFGDITKSLIGGSVEKITGKPYEFGDLSRHIDKNVKDKVNDLTGKSDYEFGDLSRFVDSKIKGEVNKFTGKESYRVGDLSKEMIRRVASGDFTLDDLFMLLKALAIFEASISPVAGFLPVKLLIDLLNFSLANDVAGRVASSLAMELDKRLKGALLGNENYKPGDATKSTIANAVKTYTGKGA